MTSYHLKLGALSRILGNMRMTEENSFYYEFLSDVNGSWNLIFGRLSIFQPRFRGAKGNLTYGTKLMSGVVLQLSDKTNIALQCLLLLILPSPLV